MPEFILIANEVYRRGQSERMDENRRCDCDSANNQWKQDRELIIFSPQASHRYAAVALGLFTDGTARKAMASLFQALMVAISMVRFTVSASENCALTSA